MLRAVLLLLFALSLGLPASAAAEPVYTPPAGYPVLIVMELTGIRCKTCVDGVMEKIKRFPEIKVQELDLKTGRLRMWAKPEFDQYVALQHSIEEAGGAISMFDCRYIVPRAYYAMIGTKGRTADKAEALENTLKAVPGVRSVLVDRDRWFVNEKGMDVGGVVIYADPNIRLEFEFVQRAKAVGYFLEMRDHGGHGGGGGAGGSGLSPLNFDNAQWSELNHSFAGICLLLLSVIGVLQLALVNPPKVVKYGSVVVWFILFLWLFIRSDRECWPLGKVGWFESFKDWEVAQHKLGMFIVLFIAIGDFMRIRSGWKANPTFSRWGILAIGVIGSGMLYTHLHQSIDPAHYAMVIRMNFQHILMATAALLFCASKFIWETWQVPKKGGQYVWLGFLAIFGLILTLYVE